MSSGKKSSTHNILKQKFFNFVMVIFLSINFWVASILSHAPTSININLDCEVVKFSIEAIFN